MTWTEVRARFCPPPADWSPVVDVFLIHGVENTLEEEDRLTGCLVDVEGTPDRLEDLRNALIEAGAADVTARPLEEVNWEEAWRAFFKPRRVGHRFVVRPTWETFEARPDDLVIVLDPGQAFGTGDHPTTRLCLELLEDADVEGKQVADVGCGSGILSVGACLLGAARVVAVDIEPQAVEVTRENAALNRVTVEAEVADGVPPSPPGGFDLLISNIISATLIRLVADVRAELKAGGRWVVSGIITSNWPDVQKAAEGLGFIVKEKREEDGWVAATFVKGQ